MGGKCPSPTYPLINGLVVVGTSVAGVTVDGHHLLQTVYKGFQTANGVSIVNLVIMKLSNQICDFP